MIQFGEAAAQIDRDAFGHFGFVWGVRSSFAGGSKKGPKDVVKVHSVPKPTAKKYVGKNGRMAR